MSQSLTVLSDVRLTKNAIVNKLGSTGEYSKILFVVAASRDNPNDETTDFIDVQIIVKSDSKGLKYLREKLLKGKRVSFSGEIHIDRWRDSSDQEKWHSRFYVFVKRYSDLEVVDYQ